MTATAERPVAERVTDKETGERYYVYPPTGEHLDSVTTVISATESKPWLRTWHATSALGWAADNVGQFVQTLVTGGRKAAIDLGKGAAEQIRDVRRDAGVYVHDVQEALILWAASPGRTGTDVAMPVLPDHLADAWYSDEELLSDVVDYMISGFINWVSHFSPRFTAAEMAVFNQPLGVAGTLDMIAELDGYWLNAAGDQVIPCPGKTLVACIDTKTGKNPEGTWKEQLAAYRRMKDCLLPLGELRPMPKTHCGAVLHLRPEYPDGYLLMLVAGAADYEAWVTFQDAASTYRRRQKVKGKPGKSVRPLRPDGTMPGPRICDLAGEGWGRALAPLAKALGPDAELEDVARFTDEELLAVKGIGPKLAEDIREMLAEHGLASPEPTLGEALEASLTARGVG